MVQFTPSGEVAAYGKTGFWKSGNFKGVSVAVRNIQYVPFPSGHRMGTLGSFHNRVPRVPMHVHHGVPGRPRLGIHQWSEARELGRRESWRKTSARKAQASRVTGAIRTDIYVNARLSPRDMTKRKDAKCASNHYYQLNVLANMFHPE
jgi:hypothetical protein